MTGKRILLLVPHPDDEVVGFALAVRDATQQGGRVLALYLTTGVPPRGALWPWQRRRYEARIARRRREAETAAATLGIEPLSFSAWPSRTLKSHLAEAAALIDAAVATHSVDAVWAPAWEGGHQDHDVANFLAARLRPRLPVVEFALYNFAGGRVRRQCFPAPRGDETIRGLAPEEQRWKAALLALYRSERGNLRHIGRAVESHRPLATYDYAAPPHPGPLFYQRFQWVPFRHPRVDFERPERVCAALRLAVARRPGLC